MGCILDRAGRLIYVRWAPAKQTRYPPDIWTNDNDACRLHYCLGGR